MYATPTTGEDHVYLKLLYDPTTNANEEEYDDIVGEAANNVRVQTVSHENTNQEANNSRQAPPEVENALPQDIVKIRRMKLYVVVAVVALFLITAVAVSVIMMTLSKNAPTAEKNDTTVQDIDECEANTHNCSDNSICINTKGSFNCTCKPGYNGDGHNCTDVDECTAPSPVCDVNANCTNTRGSYFCTCKSGFSGDGKTCTDVDECTASSPVCDVNANCTNTRGSYFCTCKSGFSGDGKTCTVSECVIIKYHNLTSSDRKVTHGDSTLCDNLLGPGWFRFHGNAGTKMPTTCVPHGKCGTHSPGWLNGPHPTVQEGKVTRKVCFTWLNCCTWSTDISVLNCGPYFLYYIDGTPKTHHCNLRYCGTD